MNILVKNKLLGYVGELNPVVQTNFDLKNTRIGYFELNIAHLVHLGERNIIYTPIPKFPGLEFDVSVIVDEKSEVTEIEKIIRLKNHDLITSVELFDIYTGPNIGKQKKAFAFRIKLQAEDRTLTDKDMAETQQKIFFSLIEAGGEIRGLLNPTSPNIDA